MRPLIPPLFTAITESYSLVVQCLVLLFFFLLYENILLSTKVRLSVLSKFSTNVGNQIGTPSSLDTRF